MCCHRCKIKVKGNTVRVVRNVSDSWTLYLPKSYSTVKKAVLCLAVLENTIKLTLWQPLGFFRAKDYLRQILILWSYSSSGISHPSTKQDQRCLAFEIWHDPASLSHPSQGMLCLILPKPPSEYSCYLRRTGNPFSSSSNVHLNIHIGLFPYSIRGWISGLLL